MALKKKKPIAKPIKKAAGKIVKKNAIKAVAKKELVKKAIKGNKKALVKKEIKKEKPVSKPANKTIAKAVSPKNKFLTKKLFELEYSVKTSPRFLYNFLSSPSGLSEWFADDVNIKDDVFSFFWEGNEEKAKLLLKRENSLVRYRWLDDPNDYYFEFKILIDDLTGDVALVITDFAEERDMKAAMLLWDTQINVLLHNLGS